MSALLLLSERFAYTPWLKPGASGSQNLVYLENSSFRGTSYMLASHLVQLSEIIYSLLNRKSF